MNTVYRRSIVLKLVALSAFRIIFPLCTLIFFFISVMSLFTFCQQYLFLTFIRALRYCEDMIQRYSRALNNTSLSSSAAALPHCSFTNVGKAVEDCMRAVIGVLLNLTHDNGILIPFSFLILFMENCKNSIYCSFFCLDCSSINIQRWNGSLCTSVQNEYIRVNVVS